VEVSWWWVRFHRRRKKHARRCCLVAVDLHRLINDDMKIWIILQADILILNRGPIFCCGGSSVSVSAPPEEETLIMGNIARCSCYNWQYLKFMIAETQARGFFFSQLSCFHC
jgi:hypothetical protein